MRISIILGTNRKDNKSKIFADFYSELLTKKGIENFIFSMNELTDTLDWDKMYDYENSPVNKLVEKYIKPADAFVFVIPEYNGSFPGIVKLMIDSIHPEHFKGKYASVIGVASGRAGNLRGIEHLNGILQHLGIHTLPNVLPISQLFNLIDENNILTDKSTMFLLEKDAEALIKLTQKHV
jgi:NAD(P)H-dependent FMN reductase